MSGQGRDCIREFYAEVLGAGRLARLEALVAPDYVPHVPVFCRDVLEPGIGALRARLARAAPRPHRLQRLIVDGELAFAHVLYGDESAVAGVDVLRLDAAGRLREHWNVRQPLKGTATQCAAHLADELAADADYPCEPEWVKARVSTMLRELWARGQVELVPEFYARSYIQHNRDMPGGFERIQQIVRHDIRQYIERTGSDFPINVHHVAAAGDLACVHLSIFMAGINRNDGARSTNVDIFRLDRQGRMIEHWDVLHIDGIPLPVDAALF